MASLPCIWGGARSVVWSPGSRETALRGVRSTFLHTLTAWIETMFPGSGKLWARPMPDREPLGTRESRCTERRSRLCGGSGGSPSTGSQASGHQRPAHGDTPPVHPVLRAAADRRYGVFTAAEAVAAGHQHSEIQNLTGSGRWGRLRRGILISADHLERARSAGFAHHVDCLAVLLALGRSQTAVSHESAAQLWDFPVPQSGDGPIRLTDPDRWRRGEGYVMSRAPLRTGETWRVGPVRLTSAARTLVDCARQWPLEDAVIAMDAALLADRTTPEELGGAAIAAQHWPGAAGAVRAAALAEGRAESPLETRGRLRIVGAGLPKPERQVEIRIGSRLVAVVDAWFDEPAVAVEFDGRIKYSDPWRGRSPERVLWEEKRREDELRALDIRVVRIADADLGARWTDTETQLGRLLEIPGPSIRRFTATPRAHGKRRTG
jgi:hypothetical protein